MKRTTMDTATLKQLLMATALLLGNEALWAQTNDPHAAHSQNADTTPTNSRDPHANSGGYTLGSAPYGLQDEHPLHLADEHYLGSVRINRLERVAADENATALDAQAWFGRDYQRLVIKAEGNYLNETEYDLNAQLLYSHAVASYWDARAGLRYDTYTDHGLRSDRTWLALGIQGLAPYWFELDATAYLGEEGRVAFLLEADYELLLTQRLILQPRAQINLYSKSDAQTDIGSGLSDVVAGLRLRYEFNRQFAPYIGIEWSGTFGETADFIEAKGRPTNETQYLLGLRFWF
jgi:copper resistance protein B